MNLFIGNFIPFGSFYLLVAKEKVEGECTGCFFCPKEKGVCCKSVFCQGKDIIFIKKEKNIGNKS